MAVPTGSERGNNNRSIHANVKITSMKEKTLRIYKRVVLFTWPIVMFLSYVSVGIAVRFDWAMGSGYGDGYPGPDRWKMLSDVLTYMGLGIAASLLLACIVILGVASMVAAFKRISVRIAFDKVYNALLLITWPVILIANVFPLLLLIGGGLKL